ncbi:hypothetical protein [Ilumatobacter nonamiensis]|uniref:hypothetical protein n=1 Tax=Ilumatobacter nonamiensis TaxID=467093 RepID=UPI0003448F69|nr:hypothetical protein [Ilumatobacter nonamiensis]
MFAVDVTRRRLIAVVALPLLVAACGGSADGDPSEGDPVVTTPAAGESTAPAFVFDVSAAIDAVEDELGKGQEYFEVTANDQFTNVFVAVDDATAAVAYAYVDGALQPPAPKQEGASGETFGRDDVDFDPEAVTSGVGAELPDSEVDAISVYGDGVGATYVVAVTSPGGGFLDVVVGADGQVFSVDPV